MWIAATISTLGDGARFAALPLLAAQLTRDPLLVAAVTLAGGLPWALFALVSGVIVDRYDRRQIMWMADAFRAVIAGALVAAVALDDTSISLLCVITFLLGTAETLFDNASQAILPTIVESSLLEKANSRLLSAQVVTLEFSGPPLGVGLFVVAAALPFALDSVSFAVAAFLMLTLRIPKRASAPTSARLRSEIVEGLRWLWRHRLLRTLALMLGLWNLVTVAGLSIFVLFALDALHVGRAGYGLLFAAGAGGAFLGGLVATRVIARLGHATALRSAVIAGAVASIIVGTASNAFVVGAMFALVGAAGIIWNVITVSLRQAIIPDRLLGRVNSVYRFVGWGTMPLGAAIGGALARWIGLRAPYIVGGVVLLVMAVVSSRVISSPVITAARAETDRRAD